MQEEIDALEKNETWELVKKPEACKPVTCKWVYRLKKNSDGTFNRFKACLFVKKESGFHVLVLLYVHDMIITRGNESEISRLRDDLLVRFEMKNLGEIGCFFGLEVDKLENGYFISQRDYTRSLLERFNMGESKPMTTPMEPNLKMKKDQGKELKDVKLFRQMVGSLIYLTITRPEIAYSVDIVSQFMQCPTNVHLDAAKRIIRYVKGSIGHGLWYKKCDNVLLNGFVDPDWMGDANDRHSTSGYCFNIGSAVISWCSKKQDVVALSSTEAEYIAATMAAQECTWLRRLIGDILEKVDYVVKLRCDKESAIKLASNPIFHAGTKHIEMRYHFIREKVLSGETELANVRTNAQVADIFTKALMKAKFIEFREALGIVDREFAPKGEC
ncbi:uncharacterized mitochondrial protein AtMg00810-like [Rutidosis leptorrhynchoides]|uniref:uncharacterized mitochondrial protein AtMg00810-like n=1 Tax=Rutidosis leptorrhynchoides TaxID=125765 RepID=UPI003A998681